MQAFQIYNSRNYLGIIADPSSTVGTPNLQQQKLLRHYSHDFLCHILSIYLQQQKLLRHYSPRQPHYIHLPIYNSRNYLGIIALPQKGERLGIYNSRNYLGIIAKISFVRWCIDLQQQKLLRHYSPLRQSHRTDPSTIVEITQALQPVHGVEKLTTIYNSRNYLGIIAGTSSSRTWLNLQQQKLLRHYSPGTSR